MNVTRLALIAFVAATCNIAAQDQQQVPAGSASAAPTAGKNHDHATVHKP